MPTHNCSGRLRAPHPRYAPGHCMLYEKAVDPAVKPGPPVCLVSEPFEMYADTNVKTCLNAVYRQLLNYIDIYERKCFGLGVV